MNVMQFSRKHILNLLQCRIIIFILLDVRNGDRKTFIGNVRESPNMHAGINSVMGMAIDWIGENLYWTDEGSCQSFI